MESVIQTFDPLTTDLNSQIAAFLVTAIVTAIALYLYNRKKSDSRRGRQQQQMLTMLGFFICLISVGSAFFSWLTTVKLKTVSISKEAIETPYGTAKIDNIRSTYFYMNEQRARFATNTALDTVRFLIIEEYGKKTHALSEENYDILGIHSMLNELIEK